MKKNLKDKKSLSIKKHPEYAKNNEVRMKAYLVNLQIQYKI